MSRMILPQAEAKIVVRNLGDTEWRDALDFDPITIPVEGDLYTTDVFDSGVMNMVEACIEAETDAAIGTEREYMLVWSENGRAVKGVCPICDDVFIVSEGFTNDTDEGISAVQCGCVDNDD